MRHLRKQYFYQQEEGGEGGSSGSGDGGEGSQNEGQNQNEGSAKNEEVEAEARRMGWTPKEEFKGDPEKWRPADEFVERGRTMMPIMRKQVERQQRQISDLEKTVRDFADHHTKVEQKAYERAFRELKAKQINAVANADAKTFVAIDEEIEALQKEALEKQKIAVPENKADDDPVYQDWAERNKWVNTDPELSAYAEAHGTFLRRTTQLTGLDFLDAVSKGVKKQFPDKFNNSRRNNAPAVEGATSPPSRGGKTFSDMPADARAACDRMAKNGYSGDTKAQAEFKANYVKQYFEEA